jgi:hypothetical protein
VLAPGICKRALHSCSNLTTPVHVSLSADGVLLHVLCAVQTFDHELWAKHRSTSRYWRHISSMTRSRVVKALAVPMVGGQQH